MLAITDSTLQLQQAFKYPIVKQLQDDYRLHLPVCVLFFMSPHSFHRCSSQLPYSTSATQTTTWMRVMASWRCRCGGQGLIFPKEEPSQCAPERQILFQLRVCVDARCLSLTALASWFFEKCKPQETIDWSRHPVTFCFSELKSPRRG